MVSSDFQRIDYEEIVDGFRVIYFIIKLMMNTFIQITTERLNELHQNHDSQIRSPM